MVTGIGQNSPFGQISIQANGTAKVDSPEKESQEAAQLQNLSANNLNNQSEDNSKTTESKESHKDFKHNEKLIDIYI